MPRSRGRRIHFRRSGRGEPRLPRFALPLRQDQADPHPARAGRRVHGGDLWPTHRQDRGLPSHARPGSDQLRYRGCLRPTRRHADADDHRAEADQEIEAGPLPDPRRRGDDGADHQVRPPARQRRQHPQPRARGDPAGRGGEARRGPPRTARGHRRRAHLVATASQVGRASPFGRSKGRAPSGSGARAGQVAGLGDRRGRQPQDDRTDAAPVRREDRHSVPDHANGQGRDRRAASAVSRLRGAVGGRFRPPRGRRCRRDRQCRPRRD